MKTFILFSGIVLCLALVEGGYLPENCPGPNEVYVTCAHNCPVSCANRHDPPMCIMACIHSACQCERDYYRNSKGVCVPLKQCD